VGIRGRVQTRRPIAYALKKELKMDWEWTINWKLKIGEIGKKKGGGWLKLVW
jgi:hypothetical protein